MRTCALGLPSRATASRQGTNRIIAALSESFEFEMFELPERAGKACFLTAPLFCPGFRPTGFSKHRVDPFLALVFQERAILKNQGESQKQWKNEGQTKNRKRAFLKIIDSFKFKFEEEMFKMFETLRLKISEFLGRPNQRATQGFRILDDKKIKLKN